MPERVLVVEQSEPVLTALRSHLEGAGFQMEVASFAEAPQRIGAGTHSLAIVRFAGGEGAEALASLKAADPTLPVVALFSEEDDASLEVPGADGLLVGPLVRSVVVSFCRAMAKQATQARLIAEMERTRSTDTGLHDYEFFKRLMLMEVKRSRRYRYPVSLALVSVDRWEEISARLDGRERAALLVGLLRVIGPAVRDVDLPLLYSKDRFLVFMPYTRSDGALLVASRLCGRVRCQSADPPVTVSAGVASFEGEGVVSLALLARQAAEALVRAQAEGGDRAVRFGPAPKRDRIVIG